MIQSLQLPCLCSSDKTGIYWKRFEERKTKTDTCGRTWLGKLELKTKTDTWWQYLAW